MNERNTTEKKQASPLLLKVHKVRQIRSFQLNTCMYDVQRKI